MDENEEYFQRQASHRQSRRRFRKINQKGERQTIIDTVDPYPVGKPPLPRGYHTVSYTALLVITLVYTYTHLVHLRKSVKPPGILNESDSVASRMAPGKQGSSSGLYGMPSVSFCLCSSYCFKNTIPPFKHLKLLVNRLTGNKWSEFIHH